MGGLFAMTILMMVASIVADPDQLQDLNGYPCKASINADDFFFSGLANSGPTNNSLVTPANVLKIPGLNTQGLSFSRIDYAPGGVNPPHTHPRASEVIYVLEGELEVGFVTTTNALVSKVIKKGDIFVFPRALMHYQKNNSNKQSASVLAAFNSQLPGTQSIGTALFGATPPIPDPVLSKAFQVGANQVGKIKSTFSQK
ncbi:hypothetical protein K2173_004036 [Erythroxylum novogranatense]|uniref:Germin-like protein n=1 Tax=Erythroxylum novogranatense TaxID=1862640 RepID=A0AAV8SKH7_9ROSI|nr:hypothetical protein K2173_004036 [Erythroxylum novogranatense]